MTTPALNREHLIHHAAWKAHQASGCKCDMDNPPTADVEAARVVVDTVEPPIRNDELGKVLAWLDGEVRAAYGRRSYVASNAYRNAARRLRAGMHRTGRPS